DLGLAPDDGVELALGGELGQVAAELVEQLRALRLLAPRTPARALLPPAGAGQHADDLVANLLGVGVEVEQDARRDTLVLAHEAEQDVLGADVVVTEGQRLSQRELEHLLCARRERNLAGGDLVTLTDDAGDLRPDLLDRDVERLEHARGKPLLLAQQPEQDVLRTDVVVLQCPRLVLRENHDLTSPFGESLEQPSPPLSACDPRLTTPASLGSKVYPPYRTGLSSMPAPTRPAPVGTRNSAQCGEKHDVADRLATGQ